MRTIVVKWVKEEEFGYGKAMRVVESSHERFVPGSRFDFGFFHIATDEGFTIVSLPRDDMANNQIQPTLKRRAADHYSGRLNYGM